MPLFHRPSHQLASPLPVSSAAEAAGPGDDGGSVAGLDPVTVDLLLLTTAVVISTALSLLPSPRVRRLSRGTRPSRVHVALCVVLSVLALVLSAVSLALGWARVVSFDALSAVVFALVPALFNMPLELFEHIFFAARYLPRRRSLNVKHDTFCYVRVGRPCHSYFRFDRRATWEDDFDGTCRGEECEAFYFIRYLPLERADKRNKREQQEEEEEMSEEEDEEGEENNGSNREFNEQGCCSGGGLFKRPRQTETRSGTERKRGRQKPNRPSSNPVKPMPRPKPQPNPTNTAPDLNSTTPAGVIRATSVATNLDFPLVQPPGYPSSYSPPPTSPSSPAPATPLAPTTTPLAAPGRGSTPPPARRITRSQWHGLRIGHTQHCVLLRDYLAGPKAWWFHAIQSGTHLLANPSVVRLDSRDRVLNALALLMDIVTIGDLVLDTRRDLFRHLLTKNGYRRGVSGAPGMIANFILQQLELAEWGRIDRSLCSAAYDYPSGQVEEYAIMFFVLTLRSNIYSVHIDWYGSAEREQGAQRYYMSGLEVLEKVKALNVRSGNPCAVREQVGAYVDDWLISWGFRTGDLAHSFAVEN